MRLDRIIIILNDFINDFYLFVWSNIEWVHSCMLLPFIHGVKIGMMFVISCAVYCWSIASKYTSTFVLIPFKGTWVYHCTIGVLANRPFVVNTYESFVSGISFLFNSLSEFLVVLREVFYEFLVVLAKVFAITFKKAYYFLPSFDPIWIVKHMILNWWVLPLLLGFHFLSYYNCQKLTFVPVWRKWFMGSISWYLLTTILVIILMMFLYFPRLTGETDIVYIWTTLWWTGTFNLVLFYTIHTDDEELDITQDISKYAMNILLDLLFITFLVYFCIFIFVLPCFVKWFIVYLYLFIYVTKLGWNLCYTCITYRGEGWIFDRYGFLEKSLVFFFTYRYKFFSFMRNVLIRRKKW